MHDQHASHAFLTALPPGSSLHSPASSLTSPSWPLPSLPSMGALASRTSPPHSLGTRLAQAPRPPATSAADDDRQSVASSTERLSRRSGKQKEARSNAVGQSRSRPARPMASLGAVLDAATQSALAAKASSSTARRLDPQAGSSSSASHPMQPAVTRTASNQTDSSPMSTTGQPPAEAERAALLPSSVGDAPSQSYDSSDEEGAHKEPDEPPPIKKELLPPSADPPPPARPPATGPTLAALSGAISTASDALSLARQTTPQTGEAEGRRRSVVTGQATPMLTRAAAVGQSLWVEGRPPAEPRGHAQATEPPEQARVRSVAKQREKRQQGRAAAAESVRTCEVERLEHAAAVAQLMDKLERRRLDEAQLLILDHVLQPATYGLPVGRLRLDFLELRKRSGATQLIDGKERSKLDSVPQADLNSMAQLQQNLLSNEELYTTAVEAVEDLKHLHASLLSNRAAHGKIAPQQGETLMQLLTRVHEEGEALKRRKAGRPPRAEAEFQLLRPRKTMVKGRYTVMAIMMSHLMRHRAAKRALSYASVNELARAGAARLVEGFDELPEKLGSAVTNIESPH